jgi:hypothetical protein
MPAKYKSKTAKTSIQKVAKANPDCQTETGGFCPEIIRTDGKKCRQWEELCSEIFLPHSEV